MTTFLKIKKEIHPWRKIKAQKKIKKKNKKESNINYKLPNLF